MKNSTFRSWLRRMWYDHLEELMEWENRVPNYTANEYYSKYRWYLRREYRSYLQNQ
jgi:hypothetical protein